MGKNNIKIPFWMKVIFIIAILYFLGILFIDDSYETENEFDNEIVFAYDGTNSNTSIEIPTYDTPDNLKIDEVNSSYLHFTNLTITFSMTGLEAKNRRERMYRALEIIENEVDEFDFVEIEDYEKANIKIDFPKMNNLYTIGEAMPIFDEDGNIEGGEITIINIEDEGCDEYPDTEIHEILHVFGFGHKEKTIMSEYSGGCMPLSSEWSIEYVEHLKFIYSNGERGVEHPNIPYLELEFYDSFCEDGTYETTNDPESCCDEPDMWTDGYYCYYSWEDGS